MKLFMVYLGGRCKNSNTELHDVRFSIGETLEGCFEDLRKQWWGDADRLHLDCWAAVEQVDGYDVAVSTSVRASTTPRLFFANMGGYDPQEFTELHRNVLLVAPNQTAAKQRGLQLVQGWKQPHKDNLFEVENLIDLGAAAAVYGCSLQLTKATRERKFAFCSEYKPIGAM